MLKITVKDEPIFFLEKEDFLKNVLLFSSQTRNLAEMLKNKVFYQYSNHLTL